MMDIQALLELMKKLRDPDGGCPWDLKQNYASIIPYTLEEAYEVAEAVDQGDMQELKSELGDLLFQVVFLSQLASEDGVFNFDDVVEAIVEKMTRRHPHVFGEVTYENEAEFKRDWEKKKQQEHREKGNHHKSLLDGVSKALPALKRAQKIQKKVSHVGFDWQNVDGVLAKVEEELDEIRMALADNESEERVAEEIGDLLFSVVNLSRFMGQDAENVLRKSVGKFERRFRCVEEILDQKGEKFEGKSEEALIEVWEMAKKMDKPA